MAKKIKSKSNSSVKGTQTSTSSSNGSSKMRGVKSKVRDFANKKHPTFSSVSTVDTAPLAIGNSLSGFSAQVVHTSNGVRVIGRDFAFSPIGTGTTAGWTLVGGIPLTPCCLPTTILKNFVQIYNKFKWIQSSFHYITSSPTSASGDIVMYHSKNAASQLPDCGSNSFLPYVMSDSGAVIGPQWTNHSMNIKTDSCWLSTDYGADSLNETAYSSGDMFLYSKTSTTDSPGYVVFDYVVEFTELSLSPRAGFLPISKAQWNLCALVNATNGTADTTNAAMTFGTTAYGLTIPAPTPAVGDVYEFILDNTASTFTTSGTPPLSYKIVSQTVPITFKNGLKLFVCYDAGSAGNSTNIRMYTTLSAALGDGHECLCHITQQYADVYVGWLKYITTNNPATYQSAY